VEFPIPAAIAFFALGANFLGTLYVLLFDPRSRGLRWFAVFELDIMAWLALQGWIFAIGDATPGLRAAYATSVHLLPALFVISALVDLHDVRWRTIAPLLAVALLTAPLSVSAFTGDPSPAIETAAVVWQLTGWGLGSMLHVRRELPGAFDPGARRRMRIVVLGFLVVVVPASVVLGWLTDDSFFIYAMPLVTVAIQVALFVGILHLRFYDIEVRSTRRGELAADAAELQRNALVGELAASFAHEVRNPLTGVRSLAQRLAEDEVGEPDRRRYAEVIMREVGRVEQIVANLLAFARRAPAAPQAPGAIELAPLYDDLRILVASRAERAGVTVGIEPRDMRVSATREALAQALLNLLLNAIEHSAAGGRVDLEARADGDAAVLVVRDQGPGIPAPERERVFEPLYSGRGGSGLGLAVVRRIAVEAGWTVEVGDAPGGGAELRLRVALAPEARSARTGVA